MLTHFTPMASLMEEVRRLTPELVMIKRPSDKPFEKPSHEDLQPLRNLIDGGVKFSAEELEEFSAMRTKAESDAAHQKAQHEYYGEAVSNKNANQAAARAEAFQQLAQLLAN